MPMDSKPDISIIIVSYNVWEYLEKCISSILLQKEISFEIIVADNNSIDGTIQNIKQKFPQVRIIHNTKNIGFSAANNAGIKEAKGDLILLLNPDTELKDTNTLAEMEKFMELNPETGILAPMLLNTDGTLQPSYWNFPKVTNLFLELFYLHRIKKMEPKTSPVEIETASGAALCFSKAISDGIGGLDENMFWMDDIDYCFRVHKTGRKITYNPGIRVIHHGGKSTTGNYFISIPNQVISKIKYFKKHGTWLQYAIQNMLSFIFIISRLIVFTILSPMGSTYRQKSTAYSVALKAYIKYNFNGNNEIVS